MNIDRLALYNGALLELGERSLDALDEEQESRRLLDEAWNQGAAVVTCLGAGQWRFATRTAQIAPDADTDPGFGYRNAYRRPGDLVRVTGVYSDEYMNVPLLDYRTEQRYWFTDAEPLYVSYVSSDELYGGDFGLWTEEFRLYVEAYLANRIVRKLTQDREEWQRIFTLMKVRLREAAARDVMESPTQFPPVGNWEASRYGRSTGRRDRGNRGSLIG